MADEHGPFRDQLHPDTAWVIRAACIRIAPGVLHSEGWPDAGDPTTPYLMNPGLYIHNDAHHISTGVTQVLIEKTTGYLRIWTDGYFNGAPIITGDEHAAEARLMFGAKKGAGDIRVVCTRQDGTIVNLADQAEYNEVAHDLLNLWVTFFSPIDRGTGAPSDRDRIATLEQQILQLQQAPPVTVSLACGHHCTPSCTSA